MIPLTCIDFSLSSRDFLVFNDNSERIRPTNCKKWRRLIIILVISIDLFVGAVLSGLGGQSVEMADRPGKIIHQTQLHLSRTLKVEEEEEEEDREEDKDNGKTETGG